MYDWAWFPLQHTMGVDNEHVVSSGSEEPVDSSESVHKAGDATGTDQSMAGVDFFSLQKYDENMWLEGFQLVYTTSIYTH